MAQCCDGIAAPSISTNTTTSISPSTTQQSALSYTSNNLNHNKHAPSSSHHSTSSSSSSPAAAQNAAAVVMDTNSNSSPEDRSQRAASVLSMDDLEAAQALEGLRSDYGQSPRSPPRSNSESKPPEPLLSLLTSSHPLISSAIAGSVTAYTTSKSYSPRFKSGAEFLERNIGSPVVSTVGTVGRKTGVESGLRWALNQQKDADRSKRRRVNGEGPPSSSEDLELGLDEKAAMTRTTSELSLPETLPPYDENTSPSYDDVGSEKPTTNTRNSNWQSRLVISTSGLGVAMSEESLHSLQYCLTWLRWANGRLGKAILALQGALKEWDASRQQNGDNQSAAANGSEASNRQTLLSQQIQAVREDVLATLKQVVNIVSKYAGGALPENARNLVRRHLTSLPHRFQIASTSQPPPDSPASSSDDTLGAHRILVLSQEGLDMMAQVSGVVNDTLVSAEHWCERLGRKRPQRENTNETASDAHSTDVKQPLTQNIDDVQMTGVEEQV